MAKLTKVAALSALADVSDNDGMMWRAPSGYAAQIAWSDLQRRGWIEWHPWAEKWLPSEAGRRALAEEG